MSAGTGITILLALRYPQLFAAVALHSAPAFGGVHSAASALSVMQRGVRGDPLALLSASVNLAQHSYGSLVGEIIVSIGASLCALATSEGWHMAGAAVMMHTHFIRRADQMPAY